MQKSHFLFDASPWFVLLCLLLGAAYAYFLYQKKGPWSKRTNYALAFLRFCLVTLLAILLLAPLVEQVKNTFVPPIYLFALDNSQSTSKAFEETEILSKIAEVGKALKDEGFDIAIRSFDKKNIETLKDLHFDYPTSDIQQLLQTVKSDFEGRNLAGLIFFSDGIYNHGVSPEYATYDFPVYTVGLGDTLPKTDVNLKALYYNKVSYEGNQFPLIAEVQHNGFKDQKIKIAVERAGKTITSKSVVLGEAPVQQIEFVLDADEKGLQHYIVKIDSLPGEFSAVNNERHAFIEIIEGKEKILLAAAAPHPDVKAILNALEQNENYEVTLYIPDIDDLPDEEAAALKFDAMILHQIPFQGGSGSQAIVERLLAKKIPAWYILGNQSDLIRFNNLDLGLNINRVGNEKDEVFPALSPVFSLFKTGGKLSEAMTYFPFVTVPFGNYEVSGNAHIMLYQKVGQVTTEKPLFLFGRSNNVKYAILAGEGIWKWRIQEYAQTGDAQGFGDLISKTIQYLSAKEDKRRFKVYPVQNEFTDAVPVVFETEIYNAIFQPIYHQPVQLEITNEAGDTIQYEYSTSPSNTTYSISGLSEGVYHYEARSTIEGKSFSSEGEFSIAKLQFEQLDLTANHHLLRKISRNSQGAFYFPNQLEKLGNDLTRKEAKGMIYTEEQYLPVIDLAWVLILLMGLVTLEWFLRKYNGSY